MLKTLFRPLCGLPRFHACMGWNSAKVVSKMNTKLAVSTIRLMGSASTGGVQNFQDSPNTIENNEEDIDEFEEELEEMDAGNMKPAEIVYELNRHIVGQDNAKRAVALALRNRWRRKRVSPSLRDEVMPKNMLMVGPTGCGKTEVARRLAKLVNAPFVKVEATKYTEIGFHGRDVDTIIRDLVENAMASAKTIKQRKLQKTVEKFVENKILEILISGESRNRRNKREFRDLLRQGVLDSVPIEIDVPAKPSSGGEFGSGLNLGMSNFKGQMMGQGGMETLEIPVSEARAMLMELELEKMIDPDDLKQEALDAVQQDGIVFIDEIDKICSTGDRMSADASAEGVQRDLLPLIEGSNIETKHGNVDTDHILFIASGAFHSCKPADMLAELQGRLPIRVELNALSENDFYRILTEPECNLILQQKELIKTEGVELNFTDEAIREIARVAFLANESVENIGARRLHTIIEKIMEDISFNACDMEQGSKIDVTKETIGNMIDEVTLFKTDLQKFIL